MQQGLGGNDGRGTFGLMRPYGQNVQGWGLGAMWGGGGVGVGSLISKNTP